MYLLLEKLSLLTFSVWLSSMLPASLRLQISVCPWTGDTRTGQVLQCGLPRAKKERVISVLLGARHCPAPVAIFLWGCTELISNRVFHFLWKHAGRTACIFSFQR